MMHSSDGAALGRHIASGDGTYQHVQRGDLLIVVLGATAGATLAAILAAGPQLLLIVALLLQLLATLAFCSSVITITAGSLSIHYGPGWFRRSVALKETAVFALATVCFAIHTERENAIIYRLLATRFSSGSNEASLLQSLRRHATRRVKRLKGPLAELHEIWLLRPERGTFTGGDWVRCTHLVGGFVSRRNGKAKTVGGFLFALYLSPVAGFVCLARYAFECRRDHVDAFLGVAVYIYGGTRHNFQHSDVSSARCAGNYRALRRKFLA